MRHCIRFSWAVIVMIAALTMYSFNVYGASSSIWSGTTVPGVADAGPDSAVELGIKFRADSNGFISGIRFYKASGNTGTHVANLWSSTGTRLATATFANETASGWQQVNFATPVAIAANTVYVASYHANSGHYSDDETYFAGKGMDSAPLHALADGVSGANGVYSYGSTSIFPSKGWNSSNYWVDVVFSATNTGTVPVVTAFSVPSTATTLTVTISSFTATDDVAVTGYLVNESATVPAASASGWTTSAPSSYTFATAGSKTLYAWAKDAAGNVSASRSAAVTITLTDTTPPTVTAFTVPASSTTLTVAISSFTATDNVAVTGYLVNESATAPAASASGWTTSAPSSYTFASAGSKTLYAWAKDAAGNVSTSKSASVAVTLTAASKPILLISSTSNPFSGYYAEILRGEGLNAFVASDISSVTSTLLASYDVVLLGEMALNSAQVTMLSNWVNAGGHLIAMRPDKKLAGLLGLVDQSSQMSEGYLLVNTASGPGGGIVDQTIQYHGTADRYALNGAASLATLYSSATTASSSPAATLNRVGSSGGQAAAFVYDLARSVVYTRQGNPAWSGQERDGSVPIRSDDLYYGAASFDPQPDWVDLNKVAIPQADEQQRLLANLIIQMNMDKRPLPRFWYLPRNLPAVVVMTGDDHGFNGTAGRFDSYIASSPPNCSLANWECIRGTSYIYPGTPLSNANAATYNAAGFEVGLHVLTNCLDWTPSSLESFYASQLASWSAKYTSLPAPVTNRTHCIAWSDFATQPAVELTHGIRLDTNYYYWPGSWIQDTPGFFTGSGMPMRFADIGGTTIDVYQAATQMTDESGQSFPFTIDTLLDRAIGPEGYYGVFVVNAHTDSAASSVSDAVIASAKARGIPVITSRQLLTWLDGRNGSSFNALAWSGNQFGFSITVASGANGLVAMVPVADGQTVTGITRNGSTVPFTMITNKGIRYARFTAVSGAYLVTYASGVTPPAVSAVAPAIGASGVSATTSVSATFSKPMDPASINSGTFFLTDAASTPVPGALSYNGATLTATLVPTVALKNSASYRAKVAGGAAGVKDLGGNPLANDFTWSFATAALPGGQISLWPDTAVPGTVDSGPDGAVELGVRFTSDSSGYVTGIRFYKAGTNTGTHVGNLWSAGGTLLASATFSLETASGWQQVIFPAPVAISANSSYVASYHTNTGHYSDDQNYFASKGVDNSPLHAPITGAGGLNGVYAYGSSSLFPNLSYRSTNYWVDVLFTTTSAPLLQQLPSQTNSPLQSQGGTQRASLVSITVAPADQRLAVGSTQQFTALGAFSDGSTSNITGQVTWASSDPNLVSITSVGKVRALALGRVTVSATLNGITGSTNLTTTDGVASIVSSRPLTEK